MSTIRELARQEDFDALFRQTAEEVEWFDAEYDEWLDAFLLDAREAWLDDVAEDDVTDVAFATLWTHAQQRGLYIPFQRDADYYDDCHGTLDDAPGYLESTAPYLF